MNISVYLLEEKENVNSLTNQRAGIRTTSLWEK
jgi:hypothetical protein